MRLIDAEKLCAELDTFGMAMCEFTNSDIIEIIRDAPSVDVVEVEHNSDLKNEIFSKLRLLFIKRMTEDSETTDRRKKEYNQAIFGYNEDGSTYQCFNGTDMQMVLDCFDNAVKDLKRNFK